MPVNDNTTINTSAGNLSPADSLLPELDNPQTLTDLVAEFGNTFYSHIEANGVRRPSSPTNQSPGNGVNNNHEGSPSKKAKIVHQNQPLIRPMLPAPGLLPYISTSKNLAEFAGLRSSFKINTKDRHSGLAGALAKCKNEFIDSEGTHDKISQFLKDADFSRCMFGGSDRDMDGYLLGLGDWVKDRSKDLSQQKAGLNAYLSSNPKDLDFANTITKKVSALQMEINGLGMFSTVLGPILEQIHQQRPEAQPIPCLPLAGERKPAAHASQQTALPSHNLFNTTRHGNG